MTAPSDPNLIAGLQAVGYLLVGGVLLWLLVPVMFPRTTEKFKQWFENAKFPPTEASISDDPAEPIDLTPEDSVRHTSPDLAEAELFGAEFRRGIEKQRR